MRAVTRLNRGVSTPGAAARHARMAHMRASSLRPLVTAWFHAGISKYVEPALRGNAARLVESTIIGGQHKFFTETKSKRVINDRHGQYDVDLRTTSTERWC